VFGSGGPHSAQSTISCAVQRGSSSAASKTPRTWNCNGQPGWWHIRTVASGSQSSNRATNSETFIGCPFGVLGKQVPEPARDVGVGQAGVEGEPLDAVDQGQHLGDAVAAGLGGWCNVVHGAALLDRARAKGPFGVTRSGRSRLFAKLAFASFLDHHAVGVEPARWCAC
jgi:hypothetical protein